MHMTSRAIEGCLIGMALWMAGANVMADQITRSVSGVTRVVLKTVGDLQVRAGADEKLVVDAEAKVIAQLDISVKGDTLVIANKGSFSTNKGVRYVLTIKSFRGLKTAASGNASVEGFSGSDVDIELDGSGDIALKNIKAGKLAIVIKSSGNVEALFDGDGHAVQRPALARRSAVGSLSPNAGVVK